MPTAYTQEIIRQTLYDEAEALRKKYSLPNFKKIDFFMQIETGPKNSIILNGFLLYNPKGNNKDCIIVPSISIDHKTSGALNVNDPYLRTPLWLQNKELEDFLNGTQNLVLTPQLANTSTTVAIIYYSVTTLMMIRNELYPSPPATGIFT